ncbi:MAG: aspartyl protease family protein [Verrucomicrobia bacterium]|nr:aspartyl protease family protein [Verrucomicrobiota bacterium]
MSALLCLLAFGGCVSTDARRGDSANTSAATLAIVPAQIVGNHFIVTVQGDERAPWRFLIDTGSTTTLVSPEFAARHASGKEGREPAAMTVRSAAGDTVSLARVQLAPFDLGGVRFKTSALVYDCAELSAHFGFKIDGVLGFPLFRHTLLTLDYPHAQLILQSARETPLLPGSTVRFNNDRHIPLIPIELGGRSVIALIDSGSDGALHLNPAGLNPRFVSGPRPGGMVGTLTGDRPQEVGRLADDLVIGGYTFPRPVVDLTDELSSLGSAILRQFTLTFDQTRNQVTFYRETNASVVSPPLRSTGLSFQKTPAYWRVLGLVPGSPADENGVQTGDLVTRINGEPVAGWDLLRYDELVRTASRIEFTFLTGRIEMPVPVDTFDLVP